MKTATLLSLREYSRQLADMEDDGNFVSEAELTRYVNDAAADYYDLLIDADDAKLLAKSGGVLTKTGDFAWDLPNDFYRLVSVDWGGGGRRGDGEGARVQGVNDALSLFWRGRCHSILP